MLSKIYEGWKNHLFPEKHLEELINDTSSSRMKICERCSFHSSNRKNYNTLRFDEHCTLCGCTLLAKTKCLSCECPDTPKKWEAVVTEEEYNKMKNHGRE